MQSPAPMSGALEVIIPAISQVELEVEGRGRWTVFFPQELTRELGSASDLESLAAVMRPYLNSDRDYRCQVDLGANPYLAAFFVGSREICFYSARMNRELFLLHHVREESLSDLGRAQFREFRSYTEKALAIRFQDAPTSYEMAASFYGFKDLLTDESYRQICRDSERKVEKLLARVNSYRPSFFERISDFALGLTAQYLLLRIHLLKFLAILPGLDHDRAGVEVKRILVETLRRLLQDSEAAERHFKIGQERPLPPWMFKNIRWVARIARALPPGPLAWGVRTAVKLMAKRFIAGETIEKAAGNFRAVFKSGRQVTLDQLGELVVSDREADHYMTEVLKLVAGFSLYVKRDERNGAGVPKAHVSIKVSALSPQFKPEAFDFTYAQVAPRLRRILLEAKQYAVFINVDAEHYHYRDLVFKIYRKVLLETPELRDFASTGIVVQAYLKDAAAHLDAVIELARERAMTMPIRLVKGAYWDAETVEGRAHGYNPPEFLNKEETDLCYRSMIYRIFDSYPHVQLCLAGHNFSDHCFAEELREQRYPKLPAIEHQCLHMTYEALSVAMAEVGWTVRNYVPIGGLLVGMGYLVRRIMENSSQVGVLTIMRSHKKKSALLLADDSLREKIARGEVDRDPTEAALSEEYLGVSPFRPYIDGHLADAVEELSKFQQRQLGRTYANAFQLTASSIVEIRSSSDPRVLVGRIPFAGISDARAAVDTVTQAYLKGSWAEASAVTRASCLLKAATLLLARRSELSALIMYEAGKSLREAYGDVDEAIDFLNFYAREAVRLSTLSYAGSHRGPVVVISPWNFPLAIPSGMVTSALVLGNPVILKSAEQTPLIAQVLVDILHESGVPKDALIHLPGEGETVGDALVKDSRVAAYVFTGSMSVGNHIYRQVGARLYRNPRNELTYPVKVITEMGGKNAVIVTPNAELDETVSGILASAFGHAGQKCSALSRVLVHTTLKDKLLERLKEASATIQVGSALDFATVVNPLIAEGDQQRVRKSVAEAVQEAKAHGGKVWVDRSQELLPGYCVGPVVIELPKARLSEADSFSRRELFAPVIHVMAYDTLDEAIELFNGIDYALTGGLFGQSQDDLDYLLQRMESGNLYVNRGITGARVGIEPFGGFKQSGTGPKAGGVQYLERFALSPVNAPLLLELSAETPADETGDAGSVPLAVHSTLSFERRLPRVLRTIDELTHHFEYLFQGIYGEDKHHLRQFREYLQREAGDLYSKGVKNRVIPGQLSVNDFSLSVDRVLVAAYEKRAYFSTLMEVLGALAMGSGVTVACRNRQALEFWIFVRRRYLAVGGAPESFKVSLATEVSLLEAGLSPSVGCVVIDGDPARVAGLGQQLLARSEFLSKGPKKILTPFDSAPLEHYPRFLEEFAWVRSYAVNTMRHGAPLNLDV